MSDTIVVHETTERVVVVREPSTTISIASPGPQGIPGPNTIGGIAISISDITNGDVLSFASAQNAWRNRAQDDVTDGGNW